MAAFCSRCVWLLLRYHNAMTAFCALRLTTVSLAQCGGCTLVPLRLATASLPQYCGCILLALRPESASDAVAPATSLLQRGIGDKLLESTITATLFEAAHSLARVQITRVARVRRVWDVRESNFGTSSAPSPCGVSSPAEGHAVTEPSNIIPYSPTSCYLSYL